MSLGAKMRWPVGVHMVGPVVVTAGAMAAVALGAPSPLVILTLGVSAAWTIWTIWRMRYASRILSHLVTALAAGQYRATVPASGVDQIDHILGDLNRVGEQVEAQLNELSLQAMRDPLTNLPNRVYLLDHLRQMNAQVRHNSSSVAVLFVNLDDFKILNDSLGHRVGDEALVAVARRLQECAGETNVVARLGGDEFAIVTVDPQAEQLAIEIAERIGQAFDLPMRVDEREVFVRASIGIALSVEGRERPRELLRNADLALSAVKRSGTARFMLFDPEMTAHLRLRMLVEQELRDGLARGEFRVYYQPLMDLAGGGFTEVEALVRWIHPERGLVSPDEFIPIAEETGLIVPLGRWVLREACRQGVEWDRNHPDNPSLIIGVNLSARQMLEPGIEEDVASALSDSGLPPERLKIEVTESLALDSSASTTNTLNSLSRLGVRFAIDDFGTGQSGLSYLRRFPVTTLKLDQSFVRGMHTNAEDARFVRGVVALAHALDLEITAEGIETPEQRDTLRLLGCKVGQGYYFARPMPADMLADFLHQPPAALAA